MADPDIGINESQEAEAVRQVLAFLETGRSGRLARRITDGGPTSESPAEKAGLFFSPKRSMRRSATPLPDVTPSGSPGIVQRYGSGGSSGCGKKSRPSRVQSVPDYVDRLTEVDPRCGRAAEM
jgi:hypothetical protein